MIESQATHPKNDKKKEEKERKNGNKSTPPAD